MAWAQGGGSGWVLLTYSSRDRKLVNAWAADHTTTIAGGVPNLAFDMYKHTYHIDFGAKALGLRPPYRSRPYAAADSLPWFAAASDQGRHKDRSPHPWPHRHGNCRTSVQGRAAVRSRLQTS
ncbi:MAG: hypothetical protein E5W39_06585, partial [Mesorhizobium sp.]